jgi:predicted transcriptional regulator
MMAPAARALRRRPAIAALDQLPARVRMAALLRGLGYSLREIGSLYGITPQAISILLMRHRAVLRQQERAPELRTLSRRAFAALSRRGIRTRREAIERNVLLLLRYERNCGAKTRREIGLWVHDSEAENPGTTVPDATSPFNQANRENPLENFA